MTKDAQKSGGQENSNSEKREPLGPPGPPDVKDDGTVIITQQIVDSLDARGLQIKQRIGKGSYASVHLAFSETLLQDVAVKIMDMDKFPASLVNKFLNRELTLLKTFKPNHRIVKFFDVFRDQNFYFIVMEVAVNGDLYEYLCKRRFIPEQQACRWVKQLAEGISHCHRQGYAHRDIKCENLLLDEQYNLKITDFGFACQWNLTPGSPFAAGSASTPASGPLDKASSLEALSKTFCGSYLYACPEILTGEPYSPTKSDIWSMGVVAWVLLFGNYPYEGDQGIDAERVNHVLESAGFIFDIPEMPATSDECKAFLRSILVREGRRATLDAILECPWFKKWPDQEEGVDAEPSFFERLGIPRQETGEFLVSRSTDNLAQRPHIDPHKSDAILKKGPTKLG